jgi:hypothetical protein
MNHSHNNLSAAFNFALRLVKTVISSKTDLTDLKQGLEGGNPQLLSEFLTF